MSITLAFLALFGAALSDFTFKRFATFKNTSMGMLFMIVGITSFTVLFCIHIQWTPLPATLFWGILGGVFSVVANLFLVRSMFYQSAGICSTVYRLNMVPVAFGAWLLLGETIPLHKWLGIALAVGVIFCFRPHETDAEKQTRSLAMAKKGLLLCINACILRAGNGLVFKVGLRHGVDSTALTAVTALCWVVGGLIYGLFYEDRRYFKATKLHLEYGIISGVLSFIIIFSTAKALSFGNASVVLPIAQMSFPVTFIMSVLFMKEPVTRLKCLGMFLAFLAIFLLSR